MSYPSEKDRVEKWRADAEARCSGFATRYASGGVGNEYIRIAKQWHTALCRPEIDPNELHAIIAEAERYQYSSDIAFFAYVNEMLSVYHQLWELSLSRETELPHE